jgi:DNA-binding protein WhiA
MTSFAQRLKSELARGVLTRRCCACAELRAFMQMNGRLLLRRNTLGITLQTQSAALARRLFSLLKFCFGLSPRIYVSHEKQLQKNNKYFIQVLGKKKVEGVLLELGFMGLHPQNGRPVLKKYLSPLLSDEKKEMAGFAGKCCRRAYLAGAFLASGSTINPETAYHLEIVSPDETYAREIIAVLSFFDLPARYFQRKNDFVVYFKGAEKIGEFLRIIAASTALLDFESIRVVKGVRNKINRLVNCETANLAKTAAASWEQVSNIRLLARVLGLDSLSPPLVQVARLRLKYPEATLQELAAAAVPPLTKSGVYHRMRRINALAEKIRENNKEQCRP